MQSENVIVVPVIVYERTKSPIKLIVVGSWGMICKAIFDGVTPLLKPTEHSRIELIPGNVALVDGIS